MGQCAAIQIVVAEESTTDRPSSSFFPIRKAPVSREPAPRALKSLTSPRQVSKGIWIGLLAKIVLRS